MKEEVCSFIDKYQLLQPGRPVIVALSGGADSVALLLLLKELEYETIALHCNFHLRGDESDRDESFVRELCCKQNIKLLVKHFETKEYASDNGISIEMAARELRYGWFRKVLQETEAQCIAVAHHKDDQAETLLLNLFRGSGLRGLAGMKPKRENIVRPLLCVEKTDILKYLNDKKQDFVTDSTNMEREATRNMLRLDVIPLLTTRYPKLCDTLSETCQRIQESLTLYKIGIEKEFQRLGINEDRFPLSALNENNESSTLLHEWLKDKHFTASQREEMLLSVKSEPGKIWESTSHRVLRDREMLIIQSKKKEKKLPKLRQEIVSEIQERDKETAYFDADTLLYPITVRQIQPGDSFVPFGMKGRKLISNYLTDRKANRFQKENQTVAICGKEIIWLIGERSDNRYRITDKTKRILKLTIERNKE